MPQGHRPQDRIDPSYFSPDTQELLRLLHDHRVRCLIVGGEAVIFYGHARLTGDIDLFYDRRATNAQRLHRALKEFWGGSIPGVASYRELMEAGAITQFGRPPNRVDLINRIDGVTFDDAWSTRNTVVLDAPGKPIPIHYLGLSMLIKNKEAAARPKDLDDLAYLKRAAKGTA